MIHEIATEIGAELVARGCTLLVVDGPEGAAQAANYWPERIVVEHDLDGTDSFAAPMSQRVDPRQTFTRWIAVKATVYAQAAEGAATVWEHRRRAEHALDMLVAAMRAVCMKRHNGLELTGGRFVTPDDLAASTTPAGAVYELKAKIARGMPAAATWDTATRPTATVGGLDGVTITNRTEANTPGNSAPAAIGCGGG